ncbi:MAG TPA: hypothetical protein VMW08_00085 [Acidimicrobiales bacterium]|nr:hypothetical protein [Acidimicrobiales bacterium]
MSGHSAHPVAGMVAFPHDGVQFEVACEALCPFADETDRHALVIEIAGGSGTIEAGSLADYLASYADTKISAEDLVVAVANEIAAQLEEDLGAPPGLVTVTTTVTVAEGRVKLTAVSCQ